MSVEAVRPEVRGTLATPTAIGAPKIGSSRLLESRVRILIEIAERFRELVDPLSGPSGVRGDGGSGPGMPPTYTATVREFERLAVRLREERRDLWWHLDGWWLSAESRTVFHCPRCGMCHQPAHRHPSRRNAGKVVEVKCKRVIAWSRRPGARESLARKAVETMAGWWVLESEPMLPEEIRIAA